jgi:acyl transferase domain-containing protein
MLAVTADEKALRHKLQNFPEITFANLNSHDQVVLAGTKVHINQVQKYLQEQGYSTIQLPVSAAFHTPLVGHAQLPFAKIIKMTSFHRPKIAVYSNATGQEYSTNPAEIQHTLSEQLLKPVRFKDEIENIHAAGGYLFVEFGPRNILTNLVKTILGDKPHIAVALNGSRKKDSDRQLREAAVQLRVAGLPLTSIDPHQILPELIGEAKLSPLSVPISGNNYVSDKTRSDFEDALNDGYRIGTLVESKELETEMQQPVIQPVVVQQPVTNGHATNGKSTNGNGHATNGKSTKPAPGIGDHRLSNVRQTLEQFQAHQNETAQTHQQYLEHQTEYAQTFVELSQQLDTVMLQATSKQSTPQLTIALENLGSSVKYFQNYQTDTVRTHEQYLQSQNQYAEAFFTAHPKTICRGRATFRLFTCSGNCNSTRTNNPKSKIQNRQSKI